MNIVTDLKAWQSIRQQLANKKIGFVPTMGNLHAGHVSLCARACGENEVTVVSVFVNPTQFNDATDFDRYPRTLDHDCQQLKSLPIDYLLAPQATSLYPDDFQVQINETAISRLLEGEYRPGHFTGMLTIVMKLLNLVQPNKLYMGEKDYQQYLLVKKMVQALFMPIEVIGCQTIRADDGLALSSRNARLSAPSRQHAVHFPRLLQSNLTPEEITAELIKLGFKVDYIRDEWQRRLGAVWLDEVRLIDNVPSK